MTKDKMSQEEFEKIELYLAGKMNSQDLKAFEESMIQDPKLKESVEDVRANIQAVQEVSLRETLDDIHSSMNKSKLNNDTPVINKVSWFKRFGVAASVAVLIGLGILWINNSGNSREKLYAEYYSVDPGLATPMSSTDNYEFYRGMVDYKQGGYDLAIERWETLKLEKPTNDSLNYFIGMAKMAQNRFGEAKTYLNIVTQSPNSIFIPEVHYFIGLLELRAGNIEVAKKEIQKSEYENASQLVKKLNNL